MVKEEQPDLFNRFRYHLRYQNGSVSKGHYKTFEAAARDFDKCKHSGQYQNLYSDLLDVVPVKIEGE